jgi:hypothetical protein
MPQKKRTKKVSNGTAVGARKTRLSHLQKVLMVNSYSDRLGDQRRRRLVKDAPKKAAS